MKAIEDRFKQIDEAHPSLTEAYIQILVKAGVFESKTDFLNRHGSVNYKLYEKTGYLTKEAAWDLATKVETGNAPGGVIYPVYLGNTNPFNVAIEIGERDGQPTGESVFKQGLNKVKLSTIDVSTLKIKDYKQELKDVRRTMYPETFPESNRPGYGWENAKANALKKYALLELKQRLEKRYYKKDVTAFFNKIQKLASEEKIGNTPAERKENENFILGKTFLDEFYAAEFKEKAQYSSAINPEDTTSKRDIFNQFLAQLGYDSLVYNPFIEFGGFDQYYEIKESATDSAFPIRDTYHVLIFPTEGDSLVKSKYGAITYNTGEPDIAFSVPRGYNEKGSIDIYSDEFEKFFKGSKVRELDLLKGPAKLMFNPGMANKELLEQISTETPKRVYAANVIGSETNYLPPQYPLADNFSTSPFVVTDLTRTPAYKQSDKYFLPEGMYLFDSPVVAREHSTTDPKYAGQLSRTLPFYINIQNPFYYTDTDNVADFPGVGQRRTNLETGEVTETIFDKSVADQVTPSMLDGAYSELMRYHFGQTNKYLIGYLEQEKKIPQTDDFFGQYPKLVKQFRSVENAFYKLRSKALLDMEYGYGDDTFKDIRVYERKDLANVFDSEILDLLAPSGKQDPFRLPLFQQFLQKLAMDTQNENFENPSTLRSLLSKAHAALKDMQEGDFRRIKFMVDNDPRVLKRIIQAGGYDGMIVSNSLEIDLMSNRASLRDGFNHTDLNQTKMYVVFDDNQLRAAKHVEAERQGNSNFRLVSKLLDAVPLLKQKKGTGKSYINQLKKFPGVTKEEIAATGLDRYLLNKKEQITPDQIENFLIRNQVIIIEKNNQHHFDKRRPTYLKKELVEDGQHIQEDDYQEMRIKLKDNILDPTALYTTEHFRGEINMLFWARMTDRRGKLIAESGKEKNPENVDLKNTIPNSNRKVLYVDELQSDWGQRGAKRGFRPPAALLPKLKEEKVQLIKDTLSIFEEYDILLNDSDVYVDKFKSFPKIKNEKLSSLYYGTHYKVPALTYFTYLLYSKGPKSEKYGSWTTESGERLRLQDGEVIANKDIVNLFKTDVKEFLNSEAEQEYLKEIDFETIYYDINAHSHAKKIVQTDPKDQTEQALATGFAKGNLQLQTIRDNNETLRRISNPQKMIPIAPFVDDTNKWVKLASKVLLTKAVVGNYDYLSFVPGSVIVGRSGQAGNLAFYDKIIPDVINSVVKKIDPTAVGSTNVKNFELGIETNFEAPKIDDRKYAPRFAIKITDKVRDAVLDEGLPLFSIPRNVAGTDINRQDDLLNANPTWSDPYQDEMRLANKLPEIMRPYLDPGQIRYNLQDKFLDGKRIQERIELEAGRIDDQFNFYDREQTYHGRTAEQVKLFVRREALPLLKSIQQLGFTQQQVNKFLHAKHAQERNREIAKINRFYPDGGSGMTNSDARDYLDGLSETDREKLERISARVQRVLQQTRTILVDSGLETQDTIDKWEEKYPTYVPLFRNLEDADYMELSEGTGGTGQGFSIGSNFSKRALGSDKPVEDILTNIIAQRERAIVRAEKNLVGQALFGLAVQAPNPEVWIAVDPRNARNPQRAAEELEEFGLPGELALNIFQPPKKATIDKKTGLVRSTTPNLNSVDNALSVRIDGKDKYVIFNPRSDRGKRLAMSMKNIDGQALGSAAIAMAPITRWIAATNTQYNPVFGGVNFSRDIQGAMIQLGTTPLASKRKEVLNNVGNAIKAIYNVERDETKGVTRNIGDYNEMERLYFEFRLKGGKTAYRDQFTNIEDRAKQMKKELEIGQRGPGLKKLDLLHFNGYPILTIL